MKKTYPTASKFLIADQIRSEIGGKHTILGLYPGDKLNLEKFDLPIRDANDGKEMTVTVTESLHVFLVFKGGLGKFNSTITILTPSGKTLAKSKEREVELKKNQDLVMTLGVAPFPVPELGEYKCMFALGNKEYTYSFSVVCEHAGVIQPEEKPKPRRKN